LACSSDILSWIWSSLLIWGFLYELLSFSFPDFNLILSGFLQLYWIYFSCPALSSLFCSTDYLNSLWIHLCIYLYSLQNHSGVYNAPFNFIDDFIIILLSLLIKISSTSILFMSFTDCRIVEFLRRHIAFIFILLWFLHLVLCI
jgi:hypothetical protein